MFSNFWDGWLISYIPEWLKPPNSDVKNKFKYIVVYHNWSIKPSSIHHHYHLLNHHQISLTFISNGCSESLSMWVQSTTPLWSNIQGAVSAVPNDGDFQGWQSRISVVPREGWLNRSIGCWLVIEHHLQNTWWWSWVTLMVMLIIVDFGTSPTKHMEPTSNQQPMDLFKHPTYYTWTYVKLGLICNCCICATASNARPARKASRTISYSMLLSDMGYETCVVMVNNVYNS